MAELARLKKLRSEVERHLGTQFSSYIKAKNIYQALSDTQRDMCLEAPIFLEAVPLFLSSGQGDYPIDDSVHKIVEVIVPEGWPEIEPVESTKWNELLKESTGLYPGYCTLLFDNITFHSAPSASESLTVWVSLKPDPDGGDDVLEDQEPITPGDYDDVLVLGAARKLLPFIPEQVRPNPNLTLTHYESMYKTQFNSRIAQLSKHTTRPRKQRKEYRF